MPPMLRRSPDFHWQYRRVVDSGKKSRILKFDFLESMINAMSTQFVDYCNDNHPDLK
jgi:hypothetical protein